jgi:hypothetical protein
LVKNSLTEISRCWAAIDCAVARLRGFAASGFLLAAAFFRLAPFVALLLPPEGLAFLRAVLLVAFFLAPGLLAFFRAVLFPARFFVLDFFF